MQKTSIFSAQQPKIGLDRNLLSNIKIDSFYDVEENEKFDDSHIDSNFIENILNQNTNNINKYKNEGVTCIYDEKVFEDQISYVNYQKLLEFLVYDETAYDNFIGESKGKWIENISESQVFQAIDKGKTTKIENENNCYNNDNNNSITNNKKEEIVKKTKKEFFESENQNFYCEFESRFESGNLRMALQIADKEYDLILKNDINSGKTSNWFFFRFTIKNVKKIKFSENPQQIKFNIINCLKADTLFSKGLKVLYFLHSKKKWYRNTKNNYYYANTITIEEKKLHSLTFSVDLNFDFDEENYFFSYCYPYTFTHFQSFLDNIMNDQLILQKNIIRHEIVGKSLAGNNLDMLIITKFDSAFEEIAYRPCIILTARVHPGESNSSYVIQGVIEFLLDNKNPIAELLRKTYIFKIVPMLNPDGVINGNFRTSLIGKDLNRLWDDPRENICPTIFYTKEMIKKTLLSRDIFIYCDFHGHSNKPNFFLYGCPSNKKVKINSNYNFHEIILSKIYSNKNDIFDHKSCIYKIVAKKLKTARAVIKTEFNIDLSYCLESSIGHISIGEKKFDFFTPKLYEKIGKDFCLSIFELQDKNIFNDVLNKLQNEEMNRINSVNNNSNNQTSVPNYEDGNKKGKENTFLSNLTKPIREKFKEKTKYLNNNNSKNNLNLMNNNVSTINFIQYEKEEIKDNSNGYFFDDKFKKKKKKLNPIKPKQGIIANAENEIQLPSNMNVLNLNTPNTININININNVNNYNSGSSNHLQMKNSASSKSLSDNSVGITNNKMIHSRSNLNVLQYNNAITENTNNSSVNLNYVYKIGSTNKCASYVPNNNINNTYQITERLKNISFKMNDKMIKENIFIKTNSISAKTNEYVNKKKDNTLYSIGNFAKGFTDPIFTDNHIIRNNSISSIKPNNSSYLNKINLISDNISMDPTKNLIPSTLRISQENLLYLNRFSKNIGGNKI